MSDSARPLRRLADGGNKLHRTVGCDELFDRLEDLPEGEDFRPIIAEHVQGWLEELEHFQASPKAVKMVRETLRKYRMKGKRVKPLPVGTMGAKVVFSEEVYSRELKLSLKKVGIFVYPDPYEGSGKFCGSHGCIFSTVRLTNGQVAYLSDKQWED